MLAEKNAAIRECVVTYKELSADEKARMQAEAREDYYRRQKDAESFAVEKGMKRGMEQGLQQGIQQGLQQGIQQGLQQGIQQGLQQGIQQGLQQGIQRGTQQMLISMVNHAMQNLSLTLEQACEGLGVTVEDYQAAKNGQETIE